MCDFFLEGGTTPYPKIVMNLPRAREKLKVKRTIPVQRLARFFGIDKKKQTFIKA